MLIHHVIVIVGVMNAPTTPPSDLGRTIRALRERRGLTRAQLAQQLGKQSGALYTWEQTGIEPPLRTLRQLAEVLDAELVVVLRPKRKPRGA